MLENLSNVSFRAILDHIQTYFVEFLRLPYYKQMNLAERAVTELVKHQHEQYKCCACCIFFSYVQGLAYSRIFKEVKGYQNLLLHVISKHPYAKIVILNYLQVIKVINLHHEHSEQI